MDRNGNLIINVEVRNIYLRSSSKSYPMFFAQSKFPNFVGVRDGRTLHPRVQSYDVSFTLIIPADGTRCQHVKHGTVIRACRIIEDDDGAVV